MRVSRFRYEPLSLLGASAAASRYFGTRDCRVPGAFVEMEYETIAHVLPERIFDRRIPHKAAAVTGRYQSGKALVINARLIGLRLQQTQTVKFNFE